MAVARRYRLFFWRWRVLCKRCKQLNEGPFDRWAYAEVRAFDESHRKAPACQARDWINGQ